VLVRSRRIITLSAIALLVLAFSPILATVTPFSKADVASAEPPGNGPFDQTWARTDKPVADGVVSRTWMWGPEANTPLLQEPYAESPGGQRTVQYFDKSRMEINHPDAENDGLWYVTNGLLVVEMVEGKYQTGDATFDDSPDPAEVNIVGDPGDATGMSPTYADINTYGLMQTPATAEGTVISRMLDADGNVTDDQTMASQNVTAAYRVTVPGIDHTVASPFWDFMNSSGTVWDGTSYTDDLLFQNPFYATGYPITEAYWSKVMINGSLRDALWQCFERRCLTYTPDNPAGFQVEAGNVGQHYYKWRYETTPPPTETSAEDVLVNFGTLNDSGVTGTARIILQGTQLTAIVDATGLVPGEEHMMHIHGNADGTEATCPTMDADTNGDGIVSLQEGVPFYGGVLLPLEPFQTADDAGHIFYKHTFDLTDQQVTDLGSLLDNTVVIHGLTVNDTYDASVPVACGAVMTGTEAMAGMDGTTDTTPTNTDTEKTSTILDAAGATVGTATFNEVDEGMQVKVSVTGLTAGEHGFHVHETGVCTAPDFTSAGGHFNPSDSQHPFHIGDLPNLTVGADGTGTMTVLTNKVADLGELNDADGSAVVIHAGPDDYMTPPSGDSGARVGCGVVYEPTGDNGNGGQEPASYSATLTALNASGASATATLALDGDQLTVTVNGTGFVTAQQHTMALYGFTDGTDAVCPSGDVTDEQGADSWGTALLNLTIGETVGDNYPVADETGSFTYQRTFTLTSEQVAQFGDFSTTVIVIHGMMDGTDYVASTPAACGEVTADATPMT
jgi:Cu/Zn superoxide dismutase